MRRTPPPETRRTTAPTAVRGSSLALLPVEVRLEPRQAPAPALSVALDPVGHVGQLGRTEVALARPAPPARLHETGVLEDPDVLQMAGQRDLQWLRQPRQGRGAGAEALEDLAPGRISHCAERP